MIQTNIQKIFEDAGIENVRPTDKALENMRMSRRRFTQLMENSHKSSITVEELSALRGWILQVKEMDPDHLVGEFESSKRLAESLGLTK